MRILVNFKSDCFDVYMCFDESRLILFTYLHARPK